MPGSAHVLSNQCMRGTRETFRDAKSEILKGFYIFNSTIKFIRDYGDYILFMDANLRVCLPPS
jgi:hypothetical protein